MVLRKTIAVICVILVTLLILPFLFFRSISNTYLNPEFYEGPVLEESYDQLISFLSEEIRKDEKVAEYFTLGEVGEIIKSNFPREDIEIILQDFVSQLKGIEDRRKGDAITVSLVPVKNNIDDLSEDVSKRIVSDIPVCDPEIDMQNIPRDNLGMPECIPVNVSKDKIQAPLKNELEKELNNIVPGEFSIDLTTGFEEEKTYLNQAVKIIEYTQLMLPFFILILLLLIALVIYKPYNLIMKYIGAGLLSGGLLTLIAVQFMNRIPQLTINEKNLPAMTEIDLEKVRNLYDILISFITSRMTNYSLYFIGIGVVIILIGLYIKHYYGGLKKAA